VLLDEIIAILTSADGSLNEALLKTKDLLWRLKRKDLVPWVSAELDGNPDDNVPQYRIIPMAVRGNIFKVGWRGDDQPIPVMHPPPETQKFLTSTAIKDSIQVLEQNLKASKNSMVLYCPPEMMPELSKGFSPGTYVNNAWCVANISKVQGILPSVRSRLLDFSLELRDVVGTDADSAELEQKTSPAQIGKMFQDAIFGPGAQIYIGSSVTQSVIVNNNPGDVNGLLKVIAQLGIHQPDLSKLKLAIEQDEAAGKKPDVAGVIAFLASEDALFINGVNLPIDGGLHASNGQPNFLSLFG
jgi:hypothetical protein